MTLYIPPTYVTFTGASDDTNIEYMFEMSERFPFIEWGILYSHKRSGNDPRYPSREWIETFIAKAHERRGINYAIHVCGKAVVDFLNVHQSVDFIWFDTDREMVRVQLNFTLSDTSIPENELRKAIAGMHPAPVITQHKPANEIITEWFLPSNHQVLFDQSGGRGIAPGVWLPPIPEKITGYAGNLGPHNIDSAGLEIMKVAAPPYWIDMETAIRTDDRLDPEKCLRVAATVDGWMTLIDEF